MTDSKRTTQDSRLAALGRWKLLRYQPTPPAKDASEKSLAFQALGTLTGVQPTVDGLPAKTDTAPLPAVSAR